MKYLINISGMHCTGCKNLITMSLEDAGFMDVSVDTSKNTATFESINDLHTVEKTLNSVFKELSGYKYFDLQTLS